ncbi:MAG: hypothetical protein J5733_00810, partial [Bacteroidaceae bacterium]|nr:hypothetical protein [Bacteroidaceae bacterium]
MKKLTLILRMSLFAALLATWSSCSKSSDVVDPNDNPQKDPIMTICEHVADVANAVDVYFDQSKSIEELSQHMDDIKKISYVEDAYTTSNSLFVKIKDYGEISYSFFEDQEFYFVDDNLSPQSRSSFLENHPMINGKRICIANAQYVEFLYENEKKDRKYIAEETQKIFNNAGYEATLINSPNLSFFTDTIYNNYDIVFFIAHGVYNDKTNLHWFLINEELENVS